MTRIRLYNSIRYKFLKSTLFFIVCFGAICCIAPTLAQRQTPTPTPTPTPSPAPRRLRPLPNILVRPTPTPGASPTPTPSKQNPITTPSTSQTGNLPHTLTLVQATGAAGSSVILQNVQYFGPSGKTAKGDLKITLAGRHLLTLPGSAFNGTAQADGTVLEGSVTLNSDVVAPDLFESGVDLIFEKAGTITVKQPGVIAEVSGGIRMRLPYFSATGEQAEVELAQLDPRAKFSIAVPASFLLKDDGAFAISQDSTVLMKPAIQTSHDGLKIDGFTIIPGGMSINFNHPGVGGKPFNFQAKTECNISTFIPNLLAQDDFPLALTVKDLVLNEDGIVSFNDAGVNFVGNINFAQPLDFAMVVMNSATSYNSDHFTKFMLEGNLVLPASVSDSRINPSRAGLMGVKFNLNGQKWDFTPGNPGTISFGTDPQALYKLTIQSYAMDLSGGGRLIVKSGELSGGTFGAGQTVPLKDGDLYIDTFGVSGSVSLPGTFTLSPKVGGFDVTVTADQNSKLVFKQNAQIAEANLPGQVVLKDMGTLFVRVYLPDNGPTVITIDPDQPLTTLNLSKYKVGIAVSSVALQPIDNGSYTLSLNGAVAFNTGAFPNLPAGTGAADVALPFNDLNLDANSGFTASSPDGLISLGNPVGIDLGVFGLNVSQFRFPVPGDDAIKLTGGVQLSGDLPLSGELDFTGLKISAGGNLDFGKISFTNLTLMDVATISGSLTKQDISVGNDPPRSYLFGDITTFHLNFAGDMSGNLHFLVGNGSWLVLGGVQLPTGIPLGSSGFELFGFRGGLGHNVRLRNPISPNFKAGNLQATDFLPTKDGNWFFNAGVRVGTDDAFLLWGDATLTVTTQPLLINLNLAANLLETMSDSPSGDRTALGNLTYDSAKGSFRTTAQVDLTFPTRSASVASAKGSADLLISPDDTHVWVGWPPSAPVGVNILGTGGLAGGLALGPGRNFGAAFSWGMDLYFISGEIDGSLSANLDNGVVLVGVLHASGEVDFYVFSASAEAMLKARMQANPFELDVTGRFDACISTWLVGDICKTLGPATFVIK